MKRDSFLSMVIADTFFVTKKENIRIDHYKADVGFYIFWEFAGRTNSKYIETSCIGIIATEMKRWFNEDCESVIGWEHIYKECSKIEKQYKKAGF